MNFVKKFYQEIQEKKRKRLKEEIRLRKLKEQFEKEPGTVRQIFKDETGIYARVRMANDGDEVWRWINGDFYAQTIERYAPADDFKTMKEFIAWIKETK